MAGKLRPAVVIVQAADVCVFVVVNLTILTTKVYPRTVRVIFCVFFFQKCVSRCATTVGNVCVTSTMNNCVTVRRDSRGPPVNKVSFSNDPCKNTLF